MARSLSTCLLTILVLLVSLVIDNVVSLSHSASSRGHHHDDLFARLPSSEHSRAAVETSPDSIPPNDSSPASHVSSLSLDDALLLPRSLLARDDGSGQTTSSTSSGDFTCGPDKPCANGACCGDSGWCGYSPTYCGDGCQSNCNATAECGQYAAIPGATCPLNVCCSEFGFCGTTSDFCETGCQSNCPQPEPSTTGTTNVQTRIVAYWESWNSNHACGTMTPDEIPVYDITHLIFAFGYITPETYKITAMDGTEPQLLDDVSFLKNKNPDLSVMIALGGWSFTDPGTYRSVFSDMVASSTARATFISNLLGFLTQYGFDGVDFDWEYPGASDRGGQDGDGKNYTKLLQELRAAIRASGKDYLVTFTAPTSYWYLQHFDLEAMSAYADWINLMAYDLHGVWDADDPIGNQVLAHTNLTEIDLALDLFWRSSIPPKDIVLGIGFYGRSFKLEDSSCWKPGCSFSGAGDEGDCTQTAGILSYKEIQDILSSTNAKAKYDEDAAVNYFVYGENNWISYDDNTTFAAKIDYANKKGLSGLMVWAIDLDDAKHSGLAALTGDTIADPLEPLADLAGSSTVGHSTSDSSQCRITDCGGFCNQAETAVGRVKAGGNSACGGDETNARWVCCPAWTSLTADQCYWNAGGGAVKTDCSGKCDVGDIKLFGDSWGWKGSLSGGEYDYRCLRGSKVFCCQAGNMQQYLDICTWTECGASCPADKQHVLTVDSGGAIGNTRCDDYVNGDVFTNPAGYSSDDDDPTKGDKSHRKLCCPAADSFKNCGWKSSKVCSEQCDNGQITLDLDPQGQGGYYCDDGRQQAFCCDAPGNANQPFLPVDLDRIFPPDYLPPADAVPQFELVNFGGGASIGVANPDLTGVAFFLMAGSSTAVTSMTKRDNPGLHFLDCPLDIMDVPLEQVQMARVICVDSSSDECFRVRENGVAGTIVHMPHECGEGSYVRAVSLEPAQNQAIPVHLALENPTSAVYEFRFDYNMGLVRRDAGAISIRMDYSNVKGYWDAVVDSPGVSSKKRDSMQSLVDRFFSSNRDDWFDTFNELDEADSTSTSDLLTKTDIEHLIYFDTEMCSISDGQQGEGIAIDISGQLNAQFYYGFSMVATWDTSSTVQVHESAGFLHVDGTTSATFTVAGIGNLDAAQKMSGSSITKAGGKSSIGGHSVYHGWATFVPYMQTGWQLTTQGESGTEVSFNGYMETKAVADWGTNANIHFPSSPSGITVKDLQLSSNSSMTPVGDDTPTSAITLANDVTLGLSITLAFSKPWQFAVGGEFPDMAIKQSVATVFSFEGADDQICLTPSVLQTQEYLLTDGAYVGWGSDAVHQYITKANSLDQQCWTGSTSAKKKKKRQNNSTPRGDFSGFEGLPDLGDLINREAAGSGLTPELNCNGCGSCVITLDGGVEDCCGCAWLPPDTSLDDDMWGYVSVSGTSYGSVYAKRFLGDDLDGSAGAVNLTAEEKFALLVERADPGGIATSRKEITFWNTNVFPEDSDPVIVESDPYPPYPDYYRGPTQTAKNFDLSSYTGVKKYFHNATGTCTSFDVVQATAFDTMFPWPETGYQGFKYARGTGYHQLYQTEHVFEGQTIARFFMTWMPASATVTRPSLWSETYILSTFASAPLFGQAWVHLLFEELGSTTYQDRLTVFMSRPNGKKGQLFSGKASVSQPTFKSRDKGPKQLLEARETGMIFGYMNLDTVWESFCDSYNGMMDVLTQFDSWYQDLTGADSFLADEWPKFIRSELDMVVKQARTDLKMMDQQRKAAGVVYTGLWSTIMGTTAGEIQKVKLDRTDVCKSLPASTVGPYTG